MNLRHCNSVVYNLGIADQQLKQELGTQAVVQDTQVDCCLGHHFL